MSPSLIEETLQRIGSPEDVLERHGIMVRRNVARCPFHDDRSPSLGLYTSRDGRERWRCHAGCGGGDAIDLAQRLGERVDLRQQRSQPRREQPIQGHRALRQFVAQFDRKAELVVAATLARIHRKAAVDEVLQNLSFLQSLGNTPEMLRGADLLRPYLFERFGVPPSLVWSPELVDKAVQELRRGRR